HIPQMLDWIEICGIWRPGQHLKLVVVVIKPFLSHFCFVAWRIILLKEATAIWEYRFHERVYMVCNNASLDFLIPVKRNCKPIAYKDILYNFIMIIVLRDGGPQEPE
ncbi:hypothetical protein QTP70_024065, partial [Hemibagrus guttatus]